MGFSRQEYWCGLPFPSPGDLPAPGIKPRSPALEADALTSEPPGKRSVGKSAQNEQSYTYWEYGPEQLFWETISSHILKKNLEKYFIHFDLMCYFVLVYLEAIKILTKMNIHVYHCGITFNIKILETTYMFNVWKMIKSTLAHPSAVERLGRHRFKSRFSPLSVPFSELPNLSSSLFLQMQNGVDNIYSRIFFRVNMMIYSECSTHMWHWNVTLKKSYQNSVYEIKLYELLWIFL